MSIWPNKTVEEVLEEMGQAEVELVDENYHAEAEYIDSQRIALKTADRAGVALGYFSWHGSDILGLNECILVRK
jgi:hypothetical protein